MIQRLFTCIIILTFLQLLPAQKGKKPTKNSSKPKVEFSNSQDSRAYLDIFEETFYKLRETYVDSINESEIIKAGIKGLLDPVDPYTKFLVGSSKHRLDMLRTGKYGGVGIQIGLRRDTLTVLAPMEDSPAYSEGIHAGDQIFKIDSTLTKGMSIKESSELIRGELGSVVILHIFRPASNQKLEFELTRANIKLNDVPYWGIDENNIAYIRIKKFSKNTANEFRQALIEMNKTGMSGLVIDLRGNSGGLLNNAVNMLDVLTPRGAELLSTKGRTERSNRTMSGRRRPVIEPDVPIAVLINRSSASASEILSGVLQDLDRAVIIGQKSFGKGLVQSMFNLNDTTTLKVTTAKYYTPSGRLIQKQDYLKNGFLTDGLDKKDSLFTTIGGREVNGGGGITPDVLTEVNKLPPYVQGLWRSGVFLTFAATYVPVEGIRYPFEVTDKIVNDFEIFLEEYEIEYSLSGERDLKRLKEKLNKNDKFHKKSFLNTLMFWKGAAVNDLTKSLDKFYKKSRAKQFRESKNQRWIRNGLLREISRVTAGDRERIKAALLEDSEYHKAVEILLDQNQYYDILSPQDDIEDTEQADKF